MILVKSRQEVVFVDQELQETRLVGSGTPGSYGLLDDLFAGTSARVGRVDTVS